MSKAFLGFDQIRQAVIEVAAVSAAENIPVVLAGGAAMQLYGSDRLTCDVDVVSTALPKSLTKRSDLSFGGSEFITPSGVSVDWIVRKDAFKKLYREASEYGVRFDTVPFPVISPEYLAVVKMVAARDKDETDLKFMLQSGKVDVAKARKIARRLLGAYAAQSFDRFVEEAEWLKARKNR